MSSNAYANGANQNCGNVITDRSTTRLHAPPGGKSSFSLAWDSGPDEGPKENRGNRGATGSGYAYMKQQELYQQPNMQQQQQPWQQNQGQFPPRSQNALMQHGDPSQLNATSRNRSNHSTLSFGDYSEARPQQQQQRGYVATARSRNQEVGGRNGGVPPGSAAFQAPESLATYQARQQEIRNPGAYQPSGEDGQQQMHQQQRQQPPYQQQQQQQMVSHQQQRQQYGGHGDLTFGAKPHGVARGSNSYANGANQNCGNVITDRSTTRIHAPPGGKSSFQLG